MKRDMSRAILRGVTPPRRARRREQGAIDQLPSGALRVRVYAGIDPVSKQQHYLNEIVPAGPRVSSVSRPANTSRRFAGIGAAWTRSRTWSMTKVGQRPRGADHDHLAPGRVQRLNRRGEAAPGQVSGCPHGAAAAAAPAAAPAAGTR